MRSSSMGMLSKSPFVFDPVEISMLPDPAATASLNVKTILLEKGKSV